MKKMASALILLVAIMVVSISFPFLVKSVQAQTDYEIKYVNHVIEPMYNGYISVKDTIQVNITGQAPDHFLLGFPYIFGYYLPSCRAYDATETFPVILDVPMENRIGFYGVEIDFPHGMPQNFTVEFVLSNYLLTNNPQNATMFGFDFPEYPSLTKPVETCNVSIVLPSDAIYVAGTVENFTYQKSNLPEYTCSSASIIFSSSIGKIQPADIRELEREIRVSEHGTIEGSDNYYITNKGSSAIESIEVNLPVTASNPSAQDQFGGKMTTPSLVDNNTKRYRVTFNLPVESDKSTRFSVKYSLSSNYLSQEGTGNFMFNISMFQNLDSFIEQMSVTFTFPEGAKILGVEDTLTNDTRSVSKDVFQEKVAITKQAMFTMDSFSVEVRYSYNSLWSSFRDTLWVWSLAIIGCAVAFIWKRPQSSAPIVVPSVGMKLGEDYLKSFVGSYEEKLKIATEIDSLEARAQKGKIPRRRYKVLRKTLETRLAGLSRNIEESKVKIRAAGGKFADSMRQLEIAETEINEVEANIKSIEARHGRGELSLEAYRNLLSGYQRRKEETLTAINGILLRLREEIR